MLKTKKGTLYEVTLQVDRDDTDRVDILRDVLLNAKIDEKAISECEQWPYRQLSVYFRSMPKALDLKQRLKAYHLNNVRILLKQLNKADWQTKWKEGFKPFVLTKQFAVIPLWLKNKRSFKGKTSVFIDSDLAFGTGLHATTRFMARFIERCRGKYERFLDLGTGTGILSVIAEKCGATFIKAVDISADAINVASRNFAENNCVNIHLGQQDAQKIRASKQYDFVAANIITQELIRMSDKIVSFVKPGKYLAVSGISLSSYGHFRRAYARYPMRCIKIEKGEGWVAILYKKRI